MHRLKIVVIELVRPGMSIYIGECDMKFSWFVLLYSRNLS